MEQGEPWNQIYYVSLTIKLPTTQTLAVIINTSSKHSARELKKMIDSIIEEHQNPLNHVICWVIDNASNMVKLVSTMSVVCTILLDTWYSKQASVTFFLMNQN
jgi:hypothetical protein